MAKMSLNIRTATITLIFLQALLEAPVSAQLTPQQPHSDSILAFSIDDKGTVAADVKLIPPRNANSVDPINKDGLLIAMLPIALDKNGRINADVDTRIAVIDSTRSLTLLAVVFPAGKSEIDFRIDGISHITETAEGKAKFELDFSYQSMSRAERDLLTSPIAISSFDTSILLPKKYDETEVNYDRSILSTKDGETFTLAADSPRRLAVSRLWIVFPSPMQSNFDKAVLILVFLVSSFGLFFHAEAFRERRIKWSVGVLLLSLTILGLTVFFTYSLAKRLEFLIVASGSIPQIIYGLITSVYLLFANKYQATIVGQVTIAGKQTDLAEVTLFRIERGNLVKVDSSKLLKNGIYTFHIWPKAVDDRYQIKAKSQYSAEGVSPEFGASRGKESEAPPLDLESLVIQADQIPLERKEER